jgi:PHD/YefM family antitoxin component YafN of YafNO toxin-antitoxin module
MLITKQAGEARGDFREVLDAVERDGDHVAVARWHRMTGVIVPPSFYRAACAALGQPVPAELAETNP